MIKICGLFKTLNGKSNHSEFISFHNSGHPKETKLVHLIVIVIVTILFLFQENAYSCQWQVQNEFSQITDWVKLKTKQPHNKFLMNGHT